MLRRVFTASALAAFASPAGAQDWPTKPLRMVIPYPPGGPYDVLPRIVAQWITAQHGWPVVIDNRTGATGVIGVMFRGALAHDARAKLSRTLACAWMAQGLVLALGTYRRIARCDSTTSVMTSGNGPSSRIDPHNTTGILWE